MSTNKNKYFTVTTTAVVSAPNQAQAIASATRSRPVQGTRVLSREASVERIAAATAQSMVG